MKKSLTLLVLLILAIGMVGPFPLQAQSQPSAPEQWPGSWVMGPALDTTMLGCTAGNGFGRFTGYYYAPQNRVYFLGGRCENNATTGAVFYFDPATRTYATTGATMPVPVSNYQVVPLEDDMGHGLGLYIVGGRTGTGAQTTAVQVYYPADNTVATIASDPFPPATPYTPGGMVSAEGKLYVFGGFDGTNMYATTWVYDPAAPAGARWSNLGCDLPTARSYIAAAAVGKNIYAIGGDEYSGGLVPLDDTLVLDVSSGGCWDDAAMPDLPQANGDAPAVYVAPDQMLGDPGGAIYVIGGYWPSPGPYSWVFRYDIASGSWEEFPALVIPDPASGRRNQAAVYIPLGGLLGLGNGVPGLWTFGGYDGSGTNAMTESSEYFSYAAHEVLLLPEQLRLAGVGGTTVSNLMTLVNLTGYTETFDLSYVSDVTWTVGMPSTIGPLAAGRSNAVTFTVDIDLPVEVACPARGTFTLTAVAQGDPAITDTQAFVADITCGLVGYVRDATTGRPIVNAYVWMQTDPAGLTGEYYDGFTDDEGGYIFTDVVTGTYYFGADAQYYMPSFYPTGWPTGSIVVDIPSTGFNDVDLLSSQMGWSPSSFDWTLGTGMSTHDTLTLNNDGTGPLFYGLGELSGAMPQPPARAQAIPKVDPQILSDLAASTDGHAEFLVVLKEQANLDAAYTIRDWNARGEYVLRQLQQTAERSQRGLRSLLDAAGVEYKPLYITNAIIVKSGTQALVDSLAARPDVDYLMANYRIAIDDPVTAVEGDESPEAVEWNILKVNADDVWALGYTGQGVVVAEIDTGTQYDHPALVNQYRGNLGGGNFDHNYNWFDPYEQCPGAGDVPCDGGQHGTHVMGTMIGDDGGTNQIGMAPGAEWISCKGGDAVSGYLLTDELLQCAEWIVAPFDLQGQNPDPAMRPHVVNNSWGGGPNDYWYTAAVDAWRAAGIFPAFATGNAGPSCSSAHSPGDNWNTFGVGATDINDAIASFSGRGPALYTGALKPQVTAPGVNIRSSVPGSAYQGGWNGTSMATPHVAGAVALLWSAAPDLIGQIDTTAWVLEQGATPLTTNEGCGGDSPTDVPNNTFGWGRLDILASVNMALDGAVTIPWLEVSPLSGMVEPGGSVDIDLAVTAPITPGVYTGTLLLWADDPVNHDVRIPLALHSVPCEAITDVNFAWSPVTPTAGLMALFTATVGGGTPPIVYTWDFGDGSGPVVVTTNTALHAYTAAGTYTVTLTVENPCSMLTVEHALVVEAVPPIHKIYLPLVFRGY